jgi:DMSO/TMAO reductase YedYZ heme-binding membrane subunit
MDAKPSGRDVSRRVRFAGAVVRGVFMCLLLAVIFLVSRPQNETIWTAYDTPGDLARLALGLAASVWILVHLFIPPRDPAAYRIWAYLGLVLVPFAIICVIAVW